MSSFMDDDDDPASEGDDEDVEDVEEEEEEVGRTVAEGVDDASIDFATASSSFSLSLSYMPGGNGLPTQAHSHRP